MPGLPDQTVGPLRLFAWATGLLLLRVLMSTGPASAQSFDCQKAFYSDEKTICQDSGLGKLDQELESVYRNRLAKMPKQQRDDIESNETLFIQARRRCGQDRKCIEQSYRNRIEEIQGARAEDDRGRPDRTRASDLHRRSSGAAAAPERDLPSGERATGAGANLAQPSEQELEPRPKNDASKGPSSDAASAAPVPPVANAPTRAEAAEALRSAEREEPAEKAAPKRYRRARAQPISPLGETNAMPAPATHHDRKRNSAATASAAPPKEQAPAPSQPAAPASSGSTGWVNPPPER
jgi:uncharacterized protein